MLPFLKASHVHKRYITYIDTSECPNLLNQIVAEIEKMCRYGEQEESKRLVVDTGVGITTDNMIAQAGHAALALPR